MLHLRRLDLRGRPRLLRGRLIGRALRCGDLRLGLRLRARLHWGGRDGADRRRCDGTRRGLHRGGRTLDAATLRTGRLRHGRTGLRLGGGTGRGLRGDGRTLDAAALRTGSLRHNRTGLRLGDGTGCGGLRRVGRTLEIVALGAGLLHRRTDRRLTGRGGRTQRR